MNAQTNLPAKRKTTSELLEIYHAGLAKLTDTRNAFVQAQMDLKTADHLAGAWVSGGISYDHPPSICELEKNLLRSAWLLAYKEWNIGDFAPTDDRKKLETYMQNPDPFTIENIREKFGDYVTAPRYHLLKGVAEAFCRLDQKYKSHNQVKVGTKGQVQRIIVSGVMPSGQYSYDTYGQKTLADVIRCIQTLKGGEIWHHSEVETRCRKAWDLDPMEFETPAGRIVLFKNGNAHLHLTADNALMVNLALAEFYGDILPDVENDTGEEDPDLFKRSTAVAKDLQFYGTPAKLADQLVGEHMYSSEKEFRILEPSCGEGAILDAVQREFAEHCRMRNIRQQPHPKIIMRAVEKEFDRVAVCRAKGYTVVHDNFLDLIPEPIYDFIPMNPPFYGQHWEQHIAHAVDFLKPRTEKYGPSGGVIRAILPASAEYDGHLKKLCKKLGVSYIWSDNDVGSFRESGTNVNTGIATITLKWKG